MNYKRNKAVTGIAVALISFFGISAIGVNSTSAREEKVICVQYVYYPGTGMKGLQITAKGMLPSECAALISKNDPNKDMYIWVNEG
ncbi:hypothetical protein [Dolichospermum sp. UHCC 0259]|uniref:hypothetical protein n=1 Tax=Dolichospermum sp. UHCC 0259 TaxID=2590010 RepID=UPI00144614E5|nr:hypothetical protein [Dolichospermum sp. UHCC 0259]